ncbi:hypothetical protein DRJ17_06295 [Candidatus Woesearchaeota archaeon]|nr:MAG: hypothetical protein DRJ17_06295 [Candidatus Woesearchaeota archaeon]
MEKAKAMVDIKKPITILLLLLLLFIPHSFALRQPVGVAGFVYLNGQPLPNAIIIVTNLNTNETDIATSTSEGIYVASLYADNGDVLRAVALTLSGENTTTVNLSRPTQWLNLSLTTATTELFRQPVGVAGIVTYNFTRISGATVYVTNVNTGETSTTTTNSKGMYATSISGSTGDTIKVVAVSGDFTGSAIGEVNLSKTTQWLNISVGSVLADFKVEPPFPKVDEPILFKDKSLGNPVAWFWSFGDGTSSTKQHPIHVYEKPGIYTVTLSVTNPMGEKSTTAGVVRVMGVEGENPYIPIPERPEYPRGYTIKQMCDLLRISDITPSSDKVTVVYIDTGCNDRTFNVEGYLLDMSKIQRYRTPGLYSSEDRYGHGTAVGSILLYILDTKVTNYRVISIKAFDDKGETTTEMFLKAMDMAKAFKPDIVSISAGAYPVENDPLVKKAEELVKNGIIVVASAGNIGQEGSILSPAIAPDVIAVGAEDPRQTIRNLQDDVLCRWSSRGYLGQDKPNVVAPGESIRLPWGKTEEHVLSGTSFSTPFVAGGIAIMISKNRGIYDLTKTLYFWDKEIVVNAVKEALEESCYIKGKRNEWGAGIPIFTIAVDRLYWKLFLLALLPVIVVIVVASSILAFIIIRKQKWWASLG